MKNRRFPLKKQFLIAWTRTIRDFYELQLINSERGLQTFFCKCLIDEFERVGVRRRIFIEPSLEAKSPQAHPTPDVLICNRDKIIAVIELKYLPRATAEYQKDLATLEWCARNAKSIHVSNSRYLGIEKLPKTYRLASDAILCWGGVFKSPKNLSLAGEVSNTLKPYFMELHGCTSPAAPPMIYSNYTPRAI